jgi:hypothetical protein
MDTKISYSLLQILHGDGGEINRGIEALCKESVAESSLIGSLVSILKGHLSSSRTVAERVEL